MTGAVTCPLKLSTITMDERVGSQRASLWTFTYRMTISLMYIVLDLIVSLVEQCRGEWGMCQLLGNRQEIACKHATNYCSNLLPIIHSLHFNTFGSGLIHGPAGHRNQVDASLIPVKDQFSRYLLDFHDLHHFIKKCLLSFANSLIAYLLFAVVAFLLRPHKVDFLFLILQSSQKWPGN